MNCKHQYYNNKICIISTIIILIWFTKTQKQIYSNLFLKTCTKHINKEELFLKKTSDIESSKLIRYNNFSCNESKECSNIATRLNAHYKIVKEYKKLIKLIVAKRTKLYEKVFFMGKYYREISLSEEEFHNNSLLKSFMIKNHNKVIDAYLKHISPLVNWISISYNFEDYVIDLNYKNNYHYNISNHYFYKNIVFYKFLKRIISICTLVRDIIEFNSIENIPNNLYGFINVPYNNFYPIKDISSTNYNIITMPLTFFKNINDARNYYYYFYLDKRKHNHVNNSIVLHNNLLPNNSIFYNNNKSVNTSNYINIKKKDINLITAVIKKDNYYNKCKGFSYNDNKLFILKPFTYLKFHFIYDYNLKLSNNGKLDLIEFVIDCNDSFN